MNASTHDIIKKTTTTFVTQEIIEVHRQADRAGVPRLMDGQQLSMAQRVSFMASRLAGLGLTQDPPPPPPSRRDWPA